MKRSRLKKRQISQNLKSWLTTRGLTGYVYRKSGYCKEVIVLVSEKTPVQYLKYLEKRHYDFIRIGKDHVDYRQALEIVNDKYGVKIVVSDSGGILNGILLEEQLAEEISLVVSPVIVGKTGSNLFRSFENGKINLKLLKYELLEDNYLHIVYHIIYIFSYE